MQFRQRLVYFFAALLLFLLAALFIAFSFSLVPFREVEYFLSVIYGNWQVAAAGLVIAIFSLWLLSKSFKKKEPVKAISQNTAHGQYMISFIAIESMILRSMKRIEGLREVHPKIVVKDNKIDILLKIVVASDYQIPAISNDIQETVKNYVEEMGGVTVNQIKVFIDNVIAEGSPPAPRPGEKMSTEKELSTEKEIKPAENISTENLSTENLATEKGSESHGE